jgi:phosphoribosylamine-glycine ligase
VIIAQVVESCLGQTNYVEIGGAHVVIKFKLFGPEASNILIVDNETITEIRA